VALQKESAEIVPCRNGQAGKNPTVCEALTSGTGSLSWASARDRQSEMPDTAVRD
jgi:hypothetical protein